MTFSENLQQTRKKLNISQEKLAEQLNITRQAISKWESGQSVPDADTLLKLSEALGVSPNRLLLGEEEVSAAEKEKQNKAEKKSDYAVFVLFMAAILICGTVLLVCNLYNGRIFEATMHTLSLKMIYGSILAFIIVTVLYAIKKRR